MGRSAGFFTHRQVTIDRFVKGRLELIDRAAMKADDIFYAGQVANENPVYIVIFDASDITPVLHHIHGAIPASSKNLRVSFTL